MIKAGMLLICMLDIGYPVGEAKVFIKDVPVKVLHVTKDNDAMVEFDLRGVEGVRYLGDEKHKDIFPVENMTDPNYMNCKRKK